MSLLLLLSSAPGGGGGGSAAYRSSTTGTVLSTTTLSITKPSGTASGDAVILFVTLDGSSGTTITQPSGFTLGGDQFMSGPDTQRAVWYHKIAGGSEPATYDFTFSASSTGLGAAVAVSGADATTPIKAIYRSKCHFCYAQIVFGCCCHLLYFYN